MYSGVSGVSSTGESGFSPARLRSVPQLLPIRPGPASDTGPGVVLGRWQRPLRYRGRHLLFLSTRGRGMTIMTLRRPEPDGNTRAEKSELPESCSGACQADRTCARLPCFQACLDAPQGAHRPQIHRRTEACANHLGAMVIAMTAWAREQDVTRADLTVLIIDPPACDSYPRRRQPRDYQQTSGFIFSIIHIGEPEADPADRCAAAV